MIGSLLKTVAYVRAPVRAYAAIHPEPAMRWTRVGYDLGHAYAPRLVALATAAVVAPLAFRLGRRAAQGTLRTPRAAAPPAAALF